MGRLAHFAGFALNANQKFFILEAGWYVQTVERDINMILLGNLKIEEMESRVGVKFPEELVVYMSSRHQSKAENIQKGFWHCFDIPFNLVCGDVETATEIHRHLSPLAGDFKTPLQISLSK